MPSLPLVLLAALMLTACASPTPDPIALPADARALCKPNERVQIGPYIYENNMWGLNKARGFTPTQCLLLREVDGRREVGWTWQWPGLDHSVFAYPQVIFGWKPWSGGNPTDARFPARVDRLASLTIEYAVETQASGAYNLAPEVWLTRSGQWSERPDPLQITGEIMFWMDHREGATPAGRLVGRPVVEGVTYELWKKENAGDRGDGSGWTLYSFRSPTRQLAGRIPVHELLAFMVREKHIAADEHVASVEFGNEVMGGRGLTWVKHFEVAATLR